MVLGYIARTLSAAYIVPTYTTDKSEAARYHCLSPGSQQELLMVCLLYTASLSNASLIHCRSIPRTPVILTLVSTTVALITRYTRLLVTVRTSCAWNTCRQVTDSSPVHVISHTWIYETNSGLHSLRVFFRGELCFLRRRASGNFDDHMGQRR